jgi:hypothetical protein
VLELIRQSSAGLTANDLYRDVELATYSQITVRKSPFELSKKGLVEQVGKRDGQALWVAVTEPAPAAKQSQARRKAKRLLDDLNDEAVGQALRDEIAERKLTRKREAEVKAAERELQATLSAEEKRVASAEREQLRLAEVARDQTHKTFRLWDDLTALANETTHAFAIYTRELEDLPPVRAAQVRLLDTALDELKAQLHRLDVRLHPRSGRKLESGVIDITPA